MNQSSIALLLAVLINSLQAQGAEMSALASATSQLQNETKVVLGCPSGELKYDSTRGPYLLKEECNLHVEWSKGLDSPEALYIPQSLVIQAVGSPDPSFSAPLLPLIDSQTFISGIWFSRDRFKYGKTYEVYVYYKIIPKAVTTNTPSAGANVLIEIPPAIIKTFAFKPVKSKIALQFTGKVFTAWELSDEGDRSFIVPGLSAGIGYRFGEDFDDKDVIALRAVAAAGPNLVPSVDLLRDEAGNISGVQTKQRIQLLIGAELVVSRYVSIGAVWIPFGREKSATPLLLLSYGDLYPAASTK